jgi:aldose 1-epimerase
MGKIARSEFGVLPSGDKVSLFNFRNSSGLEASITDYGGRVVTLKTPDRSGKLDDIVLGFDTLDGYMGHNPYFGALVGRYANRISNAAFTLDGETFHLARNNGPNSLHGGTKGFDKVFWIARELDGGDHPLLELRYLSADGEDGYPGNLEVRVTYELTENNDLRIEYHAKTDKRTVLNLTNHSYFDLSGQGKGNVLNHLVTLNADFFTPVNEHLIPTGELQSVAATPFDFRKETRIGERIDEPHQQLKLGAGYDHNFVLNRTQQSLSFAARAIDPQSGRTLEVHTTQPGVQFYTGNHLDGSVKGKGGNVYGFRSGFCFETQHFPDSPNQPNFPSTELSPGEEFHSTTVFRFSVS